MLRSKRYYGFTLIELIVSVALMLILVGAVIMIFKDSSEVFSMADAKMSVYQNGRIALDLMARELTSLDNSKVGGAEHPLIIRNPTEDDDQEILNFRTTTSWVAADGSRWSGTATIRYYLKLENEMWNLMREVTANGATNAEVLAQHIPKNANSVRMACIEYKNDNDASKVWVYTQPTSGTSKTYNSNSNPRMPDAVRMTIEFTDSQRRVTRTVSRLVWLPKSLNS